MKQQKQASNDLLKILGVGFGIAVTIGGTIGTGILRKPGPIAAALHNPTFIMLAWLLVSIYAIMGVLCAIELGVSMPKAGAWYVYAQRAFGNYVGFVIGITSWFGTVSALGFGAYTMSEYIALLIPETESYIRLIAIGILVLLTAFHALGVKSAGKSQEIMAFLKSVGLFVFVGICFVYGGNVQTQDLIATTQKVAEPALLTGLIVSFQSIFYAFDGWHTAAYFAEENTNPAKNLPKSMLGGVGLIILIYLLVNLAILYVMPMEQLAQSKLAAADAVKLIFGEQSAKIVTFFLMISILGIVNAQVMFAPRVIYSMSRDGLFIKAGQWVNRGGTPAIGMALTTICSILLIISGKDTCGRLSDIATFFFVLSYVGGFASLIQLRKTEPNLQRPYQVPFYPFLPIVMIILSALFLIGAIYQDIESSKYALIFLLFSYPIYLGVRKMNSI
jgi:basic amino acid/polyamine antiporter, APA family